MAILKTCCCWNNVKQGSMASAIYTMVVSLLNFGYGVYGLVEMDAQMLTYKPLGIARGAVETWIMTSLVCSFLMFLVSCILIRGLRKDEKYLLLPWIVGMIITILEGLISHIYQIVIVGFVSAMVVTTALWILFTAIHIYCLLCVISQYQVYTRLARESELTPPENPILGYHQLLPKAKQNEPANVMPTSPNHDPSTNGRYLNCPDGKHEDSRERDRLGTMETEVPPGYTYHHHHQPQDGDHHGQHHCQGKREESGEEVMRRQPVTVTVSDVKGDAVVVEA